MKTAFGYAAGLLLAIAGTGLGLYFAWRAFSSTPYTSSDSGLFCSVMGALVGCIYAGLGSITGHWLKARHPVVGA